MIKTIFLGTIVASVLCYLMIQNATKNQTQTKSYPDRLSGNVRSTTEPHFRIILNPKKPKSNQSIPTDKSRKEPFEDVSLLNDTAINSNDISKSDTDVEQLTSSNSTSDTTLKPSTKAAFDSISSIQFLLNANGENISPVNDIDIQTESVLQDSGNAASTTSSVNKLTLNPRPYEVIQAITESSTINPSTLKPTSPLLKLLTTPKSHNSILVESTTVTLLTPESATESIIDVNSQGLFPHEFPSTSIRYEKLSTPTYNFKTTESSKQSQQFELPLHPLLEPPSRNFSVETVTEALLSDRQRSSVYNDVIGNTYLPPPLTSSNRKNSTPPSRLYLPPNKV